MMSCWMLFPVLWMTALHTTAVAGGMGCNATLWEDLDQTGDVFRDPIDAVGGAEDQWTMAHDHFISHDGGPVDGSEEAVDVLVDEVVEDSGVMMEKVGEEVGALVGQVVEQHLAGCHLVLGDTLHHNSWLTPVLRHVSAAGVGVVVVEAWRVFSQNQSARPQLQQHLWRDNTLGCRALILMVGRNDLVFRFLEWCELWKWPKTVVVVVGGREGVEAVLYHSSLRNTLHILYFALQSRQGPSPNARPRWRSYNREADDWVRVFRRCLYCSNGQPQIELLHQGPLTSGLTQGHVLFRDQTVDMMGRQLKVGVLRYLPFVDYKMDDTPGSTRATPRDSLDVRLLNTISAHLNFTYVMQMSSDHQWGVPGRGGMWTGIVGLLQRQEVDLTNMLLYSVPRSKVIEYSKIYNHDKIVIVSLKSQPLPQHLAIISPFSDQVWQLLLVGLVLWGAALCLMQKARCWLVDGPGGLNLGSALFFTWAIMLENSPDILPDNPVARVLIGWWLVMCLVISSAYRSSLVAYLTVQEESQPIDTFEELVAHRDWTWGASPIMCMGAFREFFTEGGPLLKHVHDQMEIRTMEKSLERVLEGGFSLVSMKAMARSLISKHYTDRYGYNPFYISRTEYTYMAGYSWGFRKGAPFRRPIGTVTQRLMEAGLVQHYLEEVVAKREIISGERTSHQQHSDGGQVVLGLEHLQGAFCLLGLGCGLALLLLLVEILVHRYAKRP